MIAGNYKARATSAELGKSSEKSTQLVSVQFRITEGPFAGETIEWRGYFTEKTEERTLEALMLCGWNGEDWSTFRGIDSKDVLLVVAEEAYTKKDGTQGKSFKVKWVNDPNYVALKTMEPAEVTDFASQMRGKVLALKQKQAKPDTSFNYGANEPKPVSAVKF